MFSRRDLLTTSLAVAGGVLLGSRATEAQQMSMNNVFFDKAAPVLGNPKGKVTVVEFFDYQCPYCKSSHQMVNKVVKQDGDVRLVMKDWPIFGAASIFAAQAVLGAAQLGKYELAFEALMKTKGKLSEEMVEKTLTDAGLSMKEIATAVNKNNEKISSLLDRNYNQALGFNFAGTPAFVIGKTLYPGVLDEKALKEAIAKART